MKTIMIASVLLLSAGMLGCGSAPGDGASDPGASAPAGNGAQTAGSEESESGARIQRCLKLRCALEERPVRTYAELAGRMGRCALQCDASEKDVNQFVTNRRPTIGVLE